MPEDYYRYMEEQARRNNPSGSMVIRDSARAVTIPEPKVPLTGNPLGDPSVAERVDELLDGFARWE